MHDAFGVCRRERVDELNRDRDRRVEWDRASHDPLGEVLPGDELHHEHRASL